MKRKNEKIYLDRKGYEQYLQEIQDIRNQLNNNGKLKAESYESAVGDGWHDNFEFENAKREELRIMGLLKEKIEGLSRIVIIDEHMNKELIDINDYVTVDMIFDDEEETEQLSFQLVASSAPKFNSETQEIALSSPLGKAVYQKKIGDQTSYEVAGSITTITIINISKERENKEIVTKTLKRSN